MNQSKHDYLFFKSNLFFALEKVLINLPAGCNFQIIISIDDSEITLQPKTTSQESCFEANYKYQKAINAVYNKEQTKAKARRIIIGLNIFDKSQKLISTSETSIDPGQYLNSKMNDFYPIMLDTPLKGPNPVIYTSISLSPITVSAPSTFSNLPSTAIELSVKARKQRRGSDAFLNKLIEDNFKDTKEQDSTNKDSIADVDNAKKTVEATTRNVTPPQKPPDTGQPIPERKPTSNSNQNTSMKQKPESNSSNTNPVPTSNTAIKHPISSISSTATKPTPSNLPSLNLQQNSEDASKDRQTTTNGTSLSASTNQKAKTTAKGDQVNESNAATPTILHKPNQNSNQSDSLLPNDNGTGINSSQNHKEPCNSPEQGENKNLSHEINEISAVIDENTQHINTLIGILPEELLPHILPEINQDNETNENNINKKEHTEDQESSINNQANLTNDHENDEEIKDTVSNENKEENENNNNEMNNLPKQENEQSSLANEINSISATIDNNSQLINSLINIIPEPILREVLPDFQDDDNQPTESNTTENPSISSIQEPNPSSNERSEQPEDNQETKDKILKENKGESENQNTKTNESEEHERKQPSLTDEINSISATIDNNSKIINSLINAIPEPILNEILHDLPDEHNIQEEPPQENQMIDINKSIPSTKEPENTEKSSTEIPEQIKNNDNHESNIADEINSISAIIEQNSRIINTLVEVIPPSILCEILPDMPDTPVTNENDIPNNEDQVEDANINSTPTISVVQTIPETPKEDEKPDNDKEKATSQSENQDNLSQEIDSISSIVEANTKIINGLLQIMPNEILSEILPEIEGTDNLIARDANIEVEPIENENDTPQSNEILIPIEEEEEDVEPNEANTLPNQEENPITAETNALPDQENKPSLSDEIDSISSIIDNNSKLIDTLVNSIPPSILCEILPDMEELPVVGERTLADQEKQPLEISNEETNNKQPETQEVPAIVPTIEDTKPDETEKKNESPEEVKPEEPEKKDDLSDEINQISSVIENNSKIIDSMVRSIPLDLLLKLLPEDSLDKENDPNLSEQIAQLMEICNDNMKLIEQLPIDALTDPSKINSLLFDDDNEGKTGKESHPSPKKNKNTQTSLFPDENMQPTVARKDSKPKKINKLAISPQSYIKTSPTKESPEKEDSKKRLAVSPIDPTQYLMQQYKKQPTKPQKITKVPKKEEQVPVVPIKEAEYPVIPAKKQPISSFEVPGFLKRRNILPYDFSGILFVADILPFSLSKIFHVADILPYDLTKVIFIADVVPDEDFLWHDEEDEKKKEEEFLRDAEIEEEYQKEEKSKDEEVLFYNICANEIYYKGIELENQKEMKYQKKAKEFEKLLKQELEKDDELESTSHDIFESEALIEEMKKLEEEKSLFDLIQETKNDNYSVPAPSPWSLIPDILYPYPNNLIGSSESPDFLPQKSMENDSWDAFNDKLLPKEPSNFEIFNPNNYSKDDESIPESGIEEDEFTIKSSDTWKYMNDFLANEIYPAYLDDENDKETEEKDTEETIQEEKRSDDENDKDSEVIDSLISFVEEQLNEAEDDKTSEEKDTNENIQEEKQKEVENDKKLEEKDSFISQQEERQAEIEEKKDDEEKLVEEYQKEMLEEGLIPEHNFEFLEEKITFSIFQAINQNSRK